MRELKVPTAVMVLGGLACFVLTSCDRPTGQKPDAKVLQRANATLLSVELPVLPEGITDLRYWAGGIFAKYMNVKFTTSPEQALDYFQRAGATYYVEFAACEGQHPERYQIWATHFLGEPHDRTHAGDSFELNDAVGLVGRWFKGVYEIRHGWHYYSTRDGGVWGCEFYYDLDTQVFYLYWHYS
jgi:hypothetical protein